MEFSVMCILWSILLNAITVSSNGVDIELTCQDGWTNIGFGCYKLFTDQRPWDSARSLCHSYGGHLATTKDFFEIDELGQFVVDQGVPEFWIGADRMDGPPNSQSFLKYDNGEVVGTWIGKWDAYQPEYNNSRDCVYVLQNEESRFKWRFGPCERKVPSLCQRPVCAENSFHCISGKCLSPLAVCDGFDDCGDGSDEMDCPGLCSFVHKVDSISVTYPAALQTYPANTNCRWLIEVPVSYNVHLEIQDLSLEMDSDHLIVLAGGLTEADSQEMARFSGTLTSAEELISFNNMMIVKFQSDGFGNYYGFNLTFQKWKDETIQPRNHLTAEDNPKQLQSPFYPLYQLGDQDYTYIISAENGKGPVTVMISDLDLADDTEILIRDGDMVFHNLLATLRGSYKGNGYVISSGKDMYITMQTEKGGTHKGFSFSYWQGCDIHVTANAGFTTSPGHLVSNYPNNILCRMNVTIPTGSNVTIDIVALDLDESDSLKIYNRENNLVQSISTMNDGPIPVSNGFFEVVFESSAISNDAGFNITFSRDCLSLDLNMAETIIEDREGSHLNAYGSTFTVKCKNGSRFTPVEHRESSEVNVECMDDGNWNVRTSPRCERVYCPQVPRIVNGFVESSQGDLSYGDTVTYSCYPGFTFEGSSNITCQMNGTWSETPSCRSSGCNLSPMPDLAGNKTVIIGEDGEYGSVVEYSCGDGYDLIGTPIIFCDSAGWEGNVPTCAKLTCYMETPPNGILLPGNTVEVGEEFVIQCSEGYRTNGSANSSLCMSDRSYSNVLTCEDINECEDSPCAQSCDNTPGSYNCSCSDGFTQDGLHGCMNIDECDEEDPCEQHCDDTDGSYTCSCDDGFVLFSGNGIEGHFLPSGENGNLRGDVYWIGHSCVRKKCPSPQAYDNANLLVIKDSYFYEDVIEYACGLGYVMEIPTSGSLTCNASADWEGPDINCIEATCSVEPIPEGLVNPGTFLNNATSIGYRDVKVISCTRPGTGTFNRNRTCTIIDGEYKLDGSVEDYECGFISCGNPEPLPGSIFLSLNETYIGDTFIYACQNSTTEVKGGSVTFGNSTVVCLDNGQWDFGTLSCPGIQCSDPGRPLLGNQTRSDYRDKQSVSFGCFLPGYELDVPYPIVCSVEENGLSSWNGTVPNCTDVQNPIFTNCPSNSFEVDAYSSLHNVVPRLEIEDNGGIKSLEVSPALPSGNIFMNNVLQIQNFQYEASDYAGNTATCTVTVRAIDKVPPVVECPDSIVRTFHNDSQQTVIFSRSDLKNLADNTHSANDITVLFTPEFFTFDPTSMLTTSVPRVRDEHIIVNVSDTAGNTASCEFLLHFQPALCHPASLRTSPGSTTNCTKTSSGYTCTLSCEGNKKLFDDVSSSQKVVTCSDPDEAFPVQEIKCVDFDPNLHEGFFQHRFTYIYEANQTLNCSSIGQELPNLFTKAFEIADIYSRLCAAGPSGKFEYSGFRINLDNNTVEMDFRIDYDYDAGADYRQCYPSIVAVLRNAEASIPGLASFDTSQTCSTNLQLLTDPQLRDSRLRLTFEGFICKNEGQILEYVGDRGYCFNCTEGTYIKEGNCEPCPRGEFNWRTNFGSCEKCSEDTSTFRTGATGIAECYRTCLRGTYSDSGMSPCDNCPKDTYWVNSTYCESCPLGSITRGNGVKSIKDCKAECPAGYFNEIDGHGVKDMDCVPCPRHFYSNLTGVLRCTQCDTTEYTESVGRNSSSDCLRLSDSNACSSCVNGACRNVASHVLSCVCHDGWRGLDCDQPFNPCDSSPCYHGGTCTPSGGTFSCDCPTQTSGMNCEEIIPSCSESTCANSGMCENRPEGFTCHCLPGFSGESCGTTEDICASHECENGGTCNRHGSVRYTCSCPPNYRGTFCEESADDCFTHPCKNNGECVDGDGTYTCNCTDAIGYSGSLCGNIVNPCSGIDCGAQGQCIPDYLMQTHKCVCESNYENDEGNPLNHCVQQNFCDSDPCVNNGTCNPSLEQCSCLDGYSGSLCQHNTDDCRSDICENGGQCIDKINAYECDCQPGFDGDNCEEEIDECQPSDPCDDIGSRQCNDGINSFTCDCNPGYTGPLCGDAINECASGPCLHNGNCIDQVDHYICNCTTGWRGTNCEIPEDACSSDPCSSTADCFSVAGESFCRCAPNSFGSRCENTVEICETANSCVHGDCSEEDGIVSCSCDFNFVGDRCQHRIDYCNTEGICNDLAVCIPSLDSYECECSNGSSDGDCHFQDDWCSTQDCPANAQCLDMLQRAYCRCPLDKEGPECDRDWDQDWDLLFHGINCPSFAHMPYPVKLTSSDFSISMWVQFFRAEGNATFFTLYSTMANNSLRDPHPILHVDKNGILFNNNGTTVSLPYDHPVDENGRWHYIVINVDGNNGELSLIVDTVRVEPVDIIPVMFDLNIWPLLGCNFNTEENTCRGNDGFFGKVSRVTIYSRLLDRDSEVTRQGNDNVNALFSNSLLRWKEYEYFGCVTREAPSVADASCPFGYTSFDVCDQLLPGKNLVSLGAGQECPEDIVIYNSERLTSVSWRVPTFSGQATIRSTVEPDELFLWGKYRVVIEASNSDDNSALCLFNIYVQNDECSAPEIPANVASMPCTNATDTNAQCERQCRANYSVSIPSPVIETCGPTGNWNPLEPFLPYRMSPCGIVEPPAENIIISLFYTVPSSECEFVRRKIREELIDTQVSLNELWEKVCNYDDCHDVPISVNCSVEAAGRTEVRADIVMDDVMDFVTFRNNTSIQLSIPDLYQSLILERTGNVFDYREFITDAIPRDFDIYQHEECSPPKVLLRGECVDCGPGTFYENATMRCRFCPIGQYQPLSGQYSCNNCEDGMTTVQVGTSEDGCYTSCTPGSYFDIGEDRCKNCTYGFYQPNSGQFFCEPCSANTTTRDTGTVMGTSCANDCPRGQEIGLNNNCVPCPIGSFRTTQPSCEACPSHLVTNTTGSFTNDSCIFANNPPGTRRLPGDPSRSELCPVDTYQDQKWQSECISCGDSHRTDSRGSTSAEDCIFFCLAGYQKRANNDSCEPCPLGTFRDGSKHYEPCDLCNSNYTTTVTGATNSSECSLFRCLVGQQPTEDGDDCELCPRGTFQNETNQEQCKECPSDQFTRSSGSTRSDECETYCDSGSELTEDGNCQLCDFGFFKDNRVDVFSECSPCRERYTTRRNGSTSSDECDRLDCGPGTYTNHTTQECLPCPRGQYQDEAFQDSCKPCTGQKFTRQNRSTSSDDCEEFCDSGYERVADACRPCDRGFFKDNSIDVFTVCTACSPDLVTPEGPPAVSERSCIVPNCTAGYYVDGSDCTACPIGEYQDEWWKTNCTKCPTDKTTESEASASEDDCSLNCAVGHENPPDTDQCVPCQRGYYKDFEGIGRCLPCVADFEANEIIISNIPGAIVCDTLACAPGYYPSGDRCDRCTYGYYQPNITWSSACLRCDDGKTTYFLGASSEDHCWLSCPPGEEYLPSTKECSPCPIGYYKSNVDPAVYNCSECFRGFITEDEGSESAEECTIVDCSEPGTFRNPNNICQDCPIGTYQDIPRQTRCTDCDPNYTTRTTGRVQESECIYDCPAGSELDENLQGIPCQLCPVGTYRPKSVWTCQDCPDDLTTSGPGADERDDCNVPTCTQGSAFIDGACTVCPKDTFQDQAGQRTCQDCPDEKITSGRGATSSNDCKSPCEQNNCSITTETCVNNRSVAIGFQCECADNFVRNSATGTCRHRCDEGYCGEFATCIRIPLSCVCDDGYTGERCLTAPAASSLSDDETRDILIISITTIGVLLLIILLVVCIYMKRCHRTRDKKNKSDFDERASIATHSDMPVFAMNPVYYSKSPSIFGGSQAGMRPGSVKTLQNPTLDETEDRAVYTA